MSDPKDIDITTVGGGVSAVLLAIAVVIQKAFKKAPTVKENSSAATHALEKMAASIGELSEKISVLIERFENQANNHDELKNTVYEHGKEIMQLRLELAEIRGVR